MSDIITVISTWINHPEVLKIHRDLWLQAFPGETVRYVAYIDAKDQGDFTNFNDATVKSQLIETCKNNSIEYVIVPQELHNTRNLVFNQCQRMSDQTPSGRDALVCQYAWIVEVIIKKTSRIVLVQSDIFPYKCISWNSITRGAEFYYRPQERTKDGLHIDYAWEGLCLFDIKTWTDVLKMSIDFQHEWQKGVFTDTGGGLWKILEALPESKKYGWKPLTSLEWSTNNMMPNLPFWIEEHLRIDPRNKVDNDGTVWYYSEIFDESFFHLRAGGNWDNAGKEIHDVRYSNFIRLLTDAIKDGTVFLNSSI